MGYARSRRDKRDLSKYETLYQDPDYDQLRGAVGAKRDDRVIAGGTSVEALGGLAAIALAIVGLLAMPLEMAGAATIAAGVGMFAQGTAIMSRWREARRRLEGGRVDRHEVASGISVEVFAGIAGIVLGILALSGVEPLVLVPAGVAVFGGALLIGGAAQPDLVFLAPDRNPRHARVTYDAIQASGGVMVLVGVAAAVLAILALLGVGPILTLSLVALLAIGCALVFAGGALTSRLLPRIT